MGGSAARSRSLQWLETAPLGPQRHPDPWAPALHGTRSHHTEPFCTWCSQSALHSLSLNFWRSFSYSN